MDQIAEIAITALLVISGFFGLVGSYGLLKLPDPMTRLHAPTKTSTLGVGAVLAASMFYSWLVKGHFSFHELLIAIFLFLTAPITANFIAKAYLHREKTAADLPPTETSRDWATFDHSPDPVQPMMTQYDDPR